MIKLKSLLKENNPFDKLGGTSDANRILGQERDPKTGNLIAPDGDQNNDGYPDATAGNSPDVETFKTRDDIIKALVSEFGMKRESFYNNARTQQPEKFWTFNRLFHYYWDRKRGNK